VTAIAKAEGIRHTTASREANDVPEKMVGGPVFRTMDKWAAGAVPPLLTKREGAPLLSRSVRMCPRVE